MKQSAASSNNTISFPFIDTHCHLEMKEFDQDRQQVIAQAEKSGCEAIITVGSDMESSVRAVDIASRHEKVFASVGIHPHDAIHFGQDSVQNLLALSEHKKVVAIGETGLDYHYNRSPKGMQADAFRGHIEMAKQADLPLIIHSREAKDDTLRILTEAGGIRGVMHCFSGDADMADRALCMGLYLSFAGPVTFKNASPLREIVRSVPDDYILVETDAPYLSPHPFRGKRNEPSFIKETIACIASIRGVSIEDMARISTLNAKRLFGIGVLSDGAKIAYVIRDSLYLNITNRCSNRCSFCIKFRSDFVKGHNLRLDHEPSVREIEQEIGDPARFREIVFCGYGEPLQRLDAIIAVSRWIKEHGGRVRINTNGHAALIHGKDVLPELAGLIDSVSVSLDAQDEKTYEKLCRPLYPHAFNAVLEFIRRAKKVIPDVQVTVVETEGVDIEKTRRLADELGVPLRIRKFDVVG